jgi:hypothetical protein
MRALVMVGIVLSGVAACGPRESGTDSRAAAVTAAAPREVAFTAKDFSFEGPDTIPAGLTTLVLTNAGTTFHHLQLLRLGEGKTMADLTAGLAGMKPGDPLPAWIQGAGGVNPPDPGARTRATLMMEPGDYVIVCFVDIPDHVPHVMKGMMKPLTVTPSNASAAPMPTEDLTLTLVDYSFAFSTPPTAGHHVIKVVNGGQQDHEFELVRLAPGKTVDDFVHWGQTYEGPLPGTSLGGAAAMAPGQTEYVPMDLEPGNYIAACFVLDAKDGMPHIMHGMMTPFTVS